MRFECDIEYIFYDYETSKDPDVNLQDCKSKLLNEFEFHTQVPFKPMSSHHTVGPQGLDTKEDRISNIGFEDSYETELDLEQELIDNNPHKQVLLNTLKQNGHNSFELIELSGRYFSGNAWNNLWHRTFYNNQWVDIFKLDQDAAFISKYKIYGWILNVKCSTDTSKT